ncbi:hypothetical protein BRC64_03540 [Halobacteriales archaeon QH_10_67_22]|nr:MAG: hypothetical protein BRC64_03540 [Halobacteriales archaeon QH_10_67_22]
MVASPAGFTGGKSVGEPAEILPAESPNKSETDDDSADIPNDRNWNAAEDEFDQQHVEEVPDNCYIK